jgi:exonuclease III
MRIISWNCCWQKEGFTDKKREEILKLNPDILIVQECKQDEWRKLNYSDKNGHWYGDGKESQGDPKKSNGIGIFCDKKYSIDCSLFSGHDLSNMRYAIPYIIKYEDNEILTLFSIWAKSGYEYYHVPILNSLEHFYDKTNSWIIVAGDFNTGSQYNNKENERYYEFIKNELKAKYNLGNCAFWQEWAPTFNVEKKGEVDFYLDDHCFFEYVLKVTSFGIGNWSYWSKYSDHVPIIIDIDNSFCMEHHRNVFINSKIIKLLREIPLQDGWKEVEEFIDTVRGSKKLKYGNYTKDFK